MPFLEMRRILSASDWRYQTIDPASHDMRRIVWHLPTCFAFLAVPEDGTPADPLLDMHMAYRLFSPGEAITDHGDARTHIARAAAYVAGMSETVGGGSFYVPRHTLDSEEVDAPRFIVAEQPGGFLLRV